MARKAPLNGRARGARNSAETIEDESPVPFPGTPQFGRRAKKRLGKLKSRSERLRKSMRGGGIARQSMETEMSRQERNRQIEEEAD